MPLKYDFATSPYVKLIPNIVVIGWANVDILLAVLLVQLGQTTLARRHFAHRPKVISNGLFDVDPTSLTQQALIAYANVTPTILFHVLPWINVSDMIKGPLAIFNILRFDSFIFVLLQNVTYYNKRSYFESFDLIYLCQHATKLC